MYLKKILKHKKEEIKNLKILSKERSKEIVDPVSALKNKPFIAEVKKASPSMGDINTGIDIVFQAKQYERGGAGAISVLTDEKYFKGNISYLSNISDNVNIPTLCKDFIISEVQIENAYLSGADFILLIAAVLSSRELKVLTKKARELNLKVLYELHDIPEFKKIKKLDLELVGVNSRKLKTFSIDKKHASKVISNLNGDFLKVAESGIETSADIKLFKKNNADAFLIGTALMKAKDPIEKLKEFYKAIE